jgi:putative endonuclease
VSVGEGTTGRAAGARPDPRRTLGAAGEAAVAAWYEQRAYRVLDRNWRVREGELDLVLRTRSVVVFCEVKTRRGDAFGSPFEAVTYTKQQRIRTLATRWLQEHRVRAAQLRFDVAAVRMPRGEPPDIEVIEGAF